MTSENLAFIISIDILLCVLLLVARLIAVRLHRDPLMNRYEPSSPSYQVLAKFAKSNRSVVALVVALIGATLMLLYIVDRVREYLRLDTEEADFMLWFGPVAAMLFFGIAAATAYNLILKKQEPSSKRRISHKDRGSWLV